MIRVVRLFIAGFIVVSWLVSPALAEKRIALVIGNSNYTKLPFLANPGNDAALMSRTLRKLGFEVVSAIDADRIAIARAVRAFGRALRAGDKDAVGLFYFAGHGVQARGVNYFIPLGAQVEDEADLDIEAVSANDVLSQMETAGNALNLVILDACRNNPFKGTMRSASRGLARIQTASGSLIAFAAAPGQVATDGQGENSPYTKALVSAMQTPGLTVERVFKRVRVSVEAQTGYRQTPWEESSLRGEFYFVPGTTGSTPAAALQPAMQKIDPEAMELSFWNSIRTSKSPALYEDYINRYPQGNFAIIARSRLAAINQAKAPQTQQQVASLQSAAEPAPEPAPGRRELTLMLQRELTRVGCSPGRIDGSWGPKGRRALASFKRYARLDLPHDDLTIEVIGAVKRVRKKVCPKPKPAAKRQVTKPANPTAKRQVKKNTRNQLGKKVDCPPDASSEDAIYGYCK